jgi:hypothetical protein
MHLRVAALGRLHRPEGFNLQGAGRAGAMRAAAPRLAAPSRARIESMQREHERSTHAPGSGAPGACRDRFLFTTWIRESLRPVKPLCPLLVQSPVTRHAETAEREGWRRLETFKRGYGDRDGPRR